MKAVLWPYTHVRACLNCAYFSNSVVSREKRGQGLALRSPGFLWDAARTWEMTYGPLTGFSLFAGFFSQTELYQKKSSQSCRGWSVHTSWSLTRSRAWILFTYFLLFRWEPLCGKDRISVPGLACTLDLTGVLWVCWQQNMFSRVVPKRSPVLHLPELHTVTWPLNVPISCFSLPFW